MESARNYKTEYDEEGHIKCVFEASRKEYPFDFIMELNGKCRNKFRNAEILDIVKVPNLNDLTRAFWAVRWALRDS